MIETITIESGVPIPLNRTLEFKIALSKMKVGDSVYVKNEKEKACVRAAMGRLGYKYCSKRENEGIRVWRTK